MCDPYPSKHHMLHIIYYVQRGIHFTASSEDWRTKNVEQESDENKF